MKAKKQNKKAVKPAKKQIKKTVKKTVKKAAKKPVKKIVKKPAKKAAKKVTNAQIKKQVKQLVKTVAKKVKADKNTAKKAAKQFANKVKQEVKKQVNKKNLLKQKKAAVKTIKKAAKTVTQKIKEEIKTKVAPAVSSIKTKLKEKEEALSPKEIKEIEKRLLAMREEILERIKKNKQDADTHEVETGDEADQAGTSIEKEVGTELNSIAYKTLDQVEAALRRISKGIYGTCEYCRRPISKKRILALPFARYCIHCQVSNESTKE